MVTFEDLKNKKENIAVVGLGYVGLPLAVILSKHFDVIGLDIQEDRIRQLSQGHDHTREVSDDELKQSRIDFSSDPSILRDASFIIVAVPTPIDEDNKPDLTILKAATTMVGKQLQKGSIVVFESTVYPGVTEDICLPLLAEHSGLEPGVDFCVGYSPERVNPGDKEHTIDHITKVVSAMDATSTDVVAAVYGQITNIYRASSIRVAEAAKVIENTQRDLNIALMNELALIFDKMEMSTHDVIEAAATKWNFIPFRPGLVGGHCIGVDPYYLTHRATELGHDPKVILAGRDINDSMHLFLRDKIASLAEKKSLNIGQSAMGLWGITFKENIPDIRNSKVALLHQALEEITSDLYVYDPHAEAAEVEAEYNIRVLPALPERPVDILVVAVAHTEFAKMTPEMVRSHVKENGILIDIKRLFDRSAVEALGLTYWTL